jgi:D-alanyl-D-alanine carboxypeptidase
MKDDSSEHQYKDTQKLFDYAFDNFSIYPIADLESSQALAESPMFTRYNPLLSENSSPISTDEKGYLILPNTASFEDAKKEVTFYSASEQTSTLQNNAVVGKISYTYNGKYVGGADILYHDNQLLQLKHTETQNNNPTSAPKDSPTAKADKSLRPVILGGIIGLFVLIIILYFVLVEAPRLKRRNAYYKKRAKRKSFKDDDFLNL